MGYLFLLLSKISGIVKMTAIKNCGNIASGAKNSVKINLLRSLGCVIVAAIVSLSSGFSGMNDGGIWITFASGISNGVLLFFWILAAARAPMYLVEVFCMLGGVVFPLILSPLIIKGESVSLIQWIGVALLFLSMLCLTQRGKGKKITPLAILLMCLTGLGNMGAIMTQKLFVTISKGSVADFQLGTYAVCAAVLAIMLPIMKITDKKMQNDAPRDKFSAKVLLFIGLAIIMTYSSQILSTFASARLSSGVFYPLAYVISMPLVFLVDVIFYKEKITLGNIIGIILVTASGVLINI